VKIVIYVEIVAIFPAADAGGIWLWLVVVFPRRRGGVVQELFEICLAVKRLETEAATHHAFGRAELACGYPESHSAMGAAGFKCGCHKMAFPSAVLTGYYTSLVAFNRAQSSIRVTGENSKLG